MLGFIFQFCVGTYEAISEVGLSILSFLFITDGFAEVLGSLVKLSFELRSGVVGVQCASFNGWILPRLWLPCFFH